MTDPSNGNTPPGDAELQQMRTRVERRLAELGLELDEPGLWLEPPAFPESITAGRDEPDLQAEPVRRNWRWLGLVAGLILVLGITSVLLRDRPDWSVELGPTGDYPQAAATVRGWNLDGGTRMVLDMRGVDSAPDGFFYEMWLSEGPIHISAGTFTDTANVELMAAVMRRDYPRLWVTLEPIDEDESPTSVVVVDTGA